MGSLLTTAAAHGMTTTGTAKVIIRVSNFEGEHEEAEREDNDGKLASGEGDLPLCASEPWIRFCNHWPASFALKPLSASTGTPACVSVC